MHDDPDRCYGALSSRDARFDGWFVTAVHTTGIYCRPSCPARTPRRENVSFFPTAAAAQHAGFRACKRCRPDSSPGSPEWDLRADVVARAVRLIADGTVDREGVGGVARRVGYSERQLERLLTAELGVGPLALARAQRAQTARLLIETSAIPFTEVAFAAGFGSIRQFNDTIRAVFAATPSDMRTRTRRNPDGSRPGMLELRLPYREPFSPDSLFGHLAATSAPGCEEVRDGWFRRTLRLPNGTAIVALRPAPGFIACRLRLDDVRDLQAAVARCRRLLDLDADPVAIDAALSEDPHLGAAVAAAPGRRIPRTVDEHEMAVRIVIGQHVSTSSARVAAARLVARLGTPIDDPAGGLTHVFPPMALLAEVDLDGLGIPTARTRCIRALATALDEGRIDLGPGADRTQSRIDLATVAGIGPWTVEVVAMRALGDPDAFPDTDAGVRAAARASGLPLGRELASHAERWRPWRSYATQHLWASLDHPVNDWPPRDIAAPIGALL